MNEIQLVLGTAQLGMPYGIANTVGQPDSETTTRIIRNAWELGIKEFDTAQAYGASEKILGEAAGRLGICEHYKVITKIHPDLDLSRRDSLRRAVRKSLDLLGCPKLHGLMLHDEKLLADLPEGLGVNLFRLVEEGLVENLGISVYSPQQALTALHSDYIQLIQIPSNILDRRFERAGVFEEAEKTGKIIYVRSVFLQGLLLMGSEFLPEKMLFAKPALRQFEKLGKDSGLSNLRLALGYARQAYPSAKIIFGAETPGQVEENVKAWGGEIPVNLTDMARTGFDQVAEKIVNPSLWS